MFVRLHWKNLHSFCRWLLCSFGRNSAPWGRVEDYQGRIFPASLAELFESTRPISCWVLAFGDQTCQEKWTMTTICIWVYKSHSSLIWTTGCQAIEALHLATVSVHVALRPIFNIDCYVLHAFLYSSYMLRIGIHKFANIGLNMYCLVP